MTNYNRFFSLLLSLMLIFSLAACGAADTPEASPTPEWIGTPAPASSDQPKVNLGVIKGPTGMGAAYLMEYSGTNVNRCNYNVTLASAPSELTAMLISGELDIAALPTNAALTLYNKSEGAVKLIALNTLGVLYLLESGDSISSVSDLKGRTIYTTGQAANPEYVLNYILRENGLEPGVDVTVEFLDSDELTTLMASGQIDLAMAPVPAMNAVLMKNQDVRIALDITEEWNKLDNGSALTMGCYVVRTAFLEENPDAVDSFLDDYYRSYSEIKDPDGVATSADLGGIDAGELIAKHGIVDNPAIAAAALPYCNLCYIRGDSMKSAIEGYYQVLFDSDPSSIGGAMPDDGFWYLKDSQIA